MEKFDASATIGECGKAEETQRDDIGQLDRESVPNIVVCDR